MFAAGTCSDSKGKVPAATQDSAVKGHLLRPLQAESDPKSPLTTLRAKTGFGLLHRTNGCMTGISDFHRLQRGCKGFSSSSLRLSSWACVYPALTPRKRQGGSRCERFGQAMSPYSLWSQEAPCLPGENCSESQALNNTSEGLFSCRMSPTRSARNIGFSKTALTFDTSAPSRHGKACSRDTSVCNGGFRLRKGFDVKVQSKERTQFVPRSTQTRLLGFVRTHGQTFKNVPKALGVGIF